MLALMLKGDQQHRGNRVWYYHYRLAGLAGNQFPEILCGLVVVGLRIGRSGHPIRGLFFWFRWPPVRRLDFEVAIIGGMYPPAIVLPLVIRQQRFDMQPGARLSGELNSFSDGCDSPLGTKRL